MISIVSGKYLHLNTFQASDSGEAEEVDLSSDFESSDETDIEVIMPVLYLVTFFLIKIFRMLLYPVPQSKENLLEEALKRVTRNLKEKDKVDHTWK